MTSLQQSGSVALLNSVGAVGSKEITGTSAVTPPAGYYFFAIQFIDDSNVSARVDLTDSINANITTFTTLAGGTTVYGKWTSITLTSGSAIGYLARL